MEYEVGIMLLRPFVIRFCRICEVCELLLFGNELEGHPSSSFRHLELSPVVHFY